MKNTIISGVCCALAIAPMVASAGGFSLRERSAHAQGASFAGSTAAAADVSYMLFNPAALSSVERMETASSFSLILPDIKATAAINGETQKPGVVGVVPALAFGVRLTEDIVAGFGAFSPFGLTTEYDEDFVGAPDGIRSELIAIAAGPGVAVDVGGGLSLGGAVYAVYNDPQLTSATGVDPTTGAIQETKLDAKEIEFMGSLGALWRASENTQIGLAFHTGYDITTGGVLSTFDATGAPIQFPGDASISLPLSVSAGIRHQVTEDLALMAEFEWANWSEFDEIAVDVPALGAGRDIGETTDYKDSIFVAVGGEYAWSDALTLRTGFAYDQTPTQASSRSIRIPDADRIWASAGFSYAFSDKMRVDLGYSAIFFMDSDVTLLNGPASGTTVDYGGVTHILSVGGVYRF